MEELSIQDILNAYKSGLFPMADSREAAEFHWYDPPNRGLLPIKDLHIPTRLRQTLLKFPYEIKINSAFRTVIESCADKAPDRPSTWINDGIITLFCDLNEAGHAYSVEAWKDKALVGGVYGLAIGTAFMGESMFSRSRDASKICLVHLCARLWKAGYEILDTQFINEHLTQFGVYEMPRKDYLKLLQSATYKTPPLIFDHSQLSEDLLIHEYLLAREQSH